jgi:nitrite reductase (cytochrome c-552)
VKAPAWGRGAILTVAAVATLGTAAATALLVNIMERKQEAKNPFFRVVELDDETDDPAVWGKNFPVQYDTYKRTVDQKEFEQPGTCIHCHASVYVPYRKAGGGDLIKGFEHYNPMPYTQARKDFTHPIACIDCHDPRTMALRVTRPGSSRASRR